MPFGFAYSWISAAIGLAIRDVESTQADAKAFPSWLRTFADYDPITIAVDASGALILGGEVYPRCRKLSPGCWPC